MIIQRPPRISNRKSNLLLKRFVIGDTAVAAAMEAQVNRKTANLYFNHFRELIYEEYSRAPRLSGEIEMDQSFFGKGVKRATYDRRVMANKAGYGDIWRVRGRRRRAKSKTKPILVFGIYQRGGAVYTQIIERADRNTLFPIIHLVVEPGSTVYTDKWQGFNGLKIDGYKHKQVNHALGPVGKNGAHTGGIDSFWGGCKRLAGRHRGLARHKFALHLKEWEFRKNHKGEDLGKILKKIMKRREDYQRLPGV